MLWGRVLHVFLGDDDGWRTHRSDVDATHLCGADRSVRQHHRRARWFVWMEKTLSKNWINNFKPSVEVRELREELSEEDLEKVSGGYIGETEKNVLIGRVLLKPGGCSRAA